MSGPEPAAPTPVGVVLCGGRSSRMGRDKATIGDPPWAHRVALALEGAGCAPVELVGGDPALGSRRWPHRADARPGAGPAAALLHACGAHPGLPLVLAACDLPRLLPRDVEVLLGVVADGAAAAAYEVGGRAQWSLVALGAGRAGELAALAGGASPVSPSLHSLVAADARLVAPVDAVTVTDVDEPDETFAREGGAG